MEEEKVKRQNTMNRLTFRRNFIEIVRSGSAKNKFANEQNTQKRQYFGERDSL